MRRSALLGVVTAMQLALVARAQDGSGDRAATLPCARAASGIDAVLSASEQNEELRGRFDACLKAHRLCSAGEDSARQGQAVLWSGDTTTDMPTMNDGARGQSFAYFAARSLPRSKKTGREYCFLMTPTDRTYEWALHGWQLSARGEAMELPSQTLRLVYPEGLVSARSLAARMWNAYAAEF